jgi:hypothetical protein
MKCVRMLVSLPYEVSTLRRIFAYAYQHDVHMGHPWDARAASINVWSCGWSTVEDKRRSELLCTYYFAWGSRPRLWAQEYVSEMTATDCWHLLGVLESAAVGSPIYGEVMPAEGEGASNG